MLEIVVLKKTRPLGPAGRGGSASGFAQASSSALRDPGIQPGRLRLPLPLPLPQLMLRLALLSNK